MSITEYLWDLGYGSEICLAYVMDILGYGLNKRVPCQRLYRDIDNYLKGNYKIFSEWNTTAQRNWILFCWAVVHVLQVIILRG